MPKILWLSPYSLHDTSSGASVNVKDMLENLVKLGFEVWSCASFVFDNKSGTLTFGDLDRKLSTDPHRTFILDDNGIHYVYTRCQKRNEMEFTLAEGQLLYDTFLDVLDEFKPDIVMGYCPGMASLSCFAEARRRGIKTIYTLYNGNHGHFSFPLYDLVITDSHATARLYAERDRINVVPVGISLKPERFVNPNRDPKYITFINPVGAKGVAIFAKIAHICQKEMPDQKFLVLNTRGVFSETVSLLHEKDDANKHPFTASDFPNVDMTGPQTDMRPVYGITKALIAPSLWFESWGRVTSEAALNQIPVLCSTSGGLPEAMCGCGVALDTPEHCRNDFYSLPTDEEIRPWVEGLKTILNTDYSEQFKIAQQQLAPETTTRRLLDALSGLLRQRATDNPLYYYR